MNFVEADLVRENGVVARFGNTALPVPQEAIDAHPGVDAYLGKRVILGVRPSDFESTTEPGVEGLPVIDAVAEVTEALGSEIMVLFRIDAPPVQHADATAAAHDREDQDAGVIGQDKALWTARVSPETRVRHGSRIQLAVDNRKMHFFDPTSGQAIGFSEAAQQMAASSPANR
jgi:multiple sugar transport system ATP-binding protein